MHKFATVVFRDVENFCNAFARKQVHISHTTSDEVKENIPLDPKKLSLEADSIFRLMLMNSRGGPPILGLYVDEF